MANATAVCTKIRPQLALAALGRGVNLPSPNRPYIPSILVYALLTGMNLAKHLQTKNVFSRVRNSSWSAVAKMIQYSLKCSEGHRFDSWFQSASAYDKLKASGLVTCSHCGSTKVEKAIMAPRVQSSRKSAAAAQEGAARKAQSAQTGTQSTTEAQPGATPPPAAPPNLSEPSSDQERALTALRKEVEANSEYVGESFADEARAMHLGDAPERAIHGEAKLDEAKQLIDDGVPVVPLPFRPGRKSS